jgi:RNA polymerase sigma factor (sigma-70 family)
MNEADRDLPFEELVRALRAGDGAAWTRVFERLLPRATEQLQKAFGTEIARPENAGGQAVASACRTIYRNIVAGKFELHDWDDLAGLFLTIATNKCVDHLHDQQRFVTNQDSDLPSEPMAPGRSPPEEAIRAEAAQEFRRIVDLVRRRLKRVDERYCEIFKLRLEGRWRNAQIAARVGCSEATVKRAWSYAVHLLKELLDGSVVEDILG